MKKGNAASLGGFLEFSVSSVRKVLEHARKKHVSIDEPSEAGTSYPIVLLVADSDGVYLASQPSSCDDEGDIQFAFADGMAPGAWSDKFAFTREIAKRVGTEPQVIPLEADAFDLVMSKANDWDVAILGVKHDGSRMSRILVMPVRESVGMHIDAPQSMATRSAEIESMIGQI